MNEKVSIIEHQKNEELKLLSYYIYEAECYGGSS